MGIPVILVISWVMASVTSEGQQYEGEVCMKSLHQDNYLQYKISLKGYRMIRRTG